MLDKAIVFSLSLTMMVILALQTVWMTLPFFQRMAFDAACHRTLMSMDHAGGLTDAARLNLETDLREQGLNSLEIYGDQAVDFGREMTLEVHAVVQTRRISPTLILTPIPRTFVYRNSVLSRHLITSAGEP